MERASLLLQKRLDGRVVAGPVGYGVVVGAGYEHLVVWGGGADRVIELAGVLGVYEIVGAAVQQQHADSRCLCSRLDFVEVVELLVRHEALGNDERAIGHQRGNG